MTLLHAKHTVENSIEEISDTSEQDVMEVIVQISDPALKKSGLRNNATKALMRRHLATSARDIIPEKHRKKPIESKPQKISGYKKASSKRLSSLMKISSIQDGLTRLEDEFLSHSVSGQQYKPSAFWSSNSMLLKLSKQELAELPKTVPNIRDVQLNRRLSIPVVRTNKPLAIELQDRLSTSWGLESTNAFGAWGVYGAEGQNTKIAVLDTGVDADHPDLQDKVTDWAEFDHMGNLIDDANPRDSDQHGTHVAGTIAGGNASGRWIGMAPQAEIAAALVLDGENGGTDAQVLAGMDWAVENNVDAINMSLGGLVMDAETPPTYTEAIVSAITAGIPVVCAIGNEGGQTSGLPGSDLFAFSIGATNHKDMVAGFSGGRTQIVYESDYLRPYDLPLPYIKPDISAPGVAVFSAIPGGRWEAFSGTSMATPHVSGAIALLLSATSLRDQLSDEDLAFKIQELLSRSVDELGEHGQDCRYGYGRLDALRSIDFAVDEGFGID